MGNINEIITNAYRNASNETFRINPELTLKAATLDAAWAKHGLNSSASSHIICDDDEEYTVEELRQSFEDLLFYFATDADHSGNKGKWRTSFMSASKNVFIARLDLDELVTDFRAVLGAVKLDEVPADTICKVEALGYHPTLTCKGDFIPTTEITAIIELDGSKDADLGDCCSSLKGEPVLVTWFPGRQLPTSNPTNCQIGDVMTAAEAKAKGWSTVSFKN